MAYFSRFYKKENLISRSLDIDEELYSELEYLSKNVYEASISKLVNASIEKLIEKEEIQVYERKNKSYVSRSFLIRESLIEGLYVLKDKYRISICLLVNIAIRNALIEEKKEENWIFWNGDGSFLKKEPSPFQKNKNICQKTTKMQKNVVK